MDEATPTHDPTLSIDKKVAIVGIGCRFPNNINNVNDFWRIVSEGEDCMIPHPPERIDPSFIYPGEKLPGKLYNIRAGYLSQDIHEFDREFFQMSPDEASNMDPQQRILLEVAWEALEDYGVNIETLRKSQTGVYVGVMANEYIVNISVPADHVDQYAATGNNSNMISNRISYQFDFQGPSVTIDTACSSSMYAIHLACEAIRKCECNLALAGGVNLTQSPGTTVQLCQARMLSNDGRCKSFDELADGYGRGEGAGVLVLKSLKDALADSDRIYAVIRGGALNNDGKTKGITSPNADSQIQLLRKAYAISNVKPHDVPYVEAHGTGTQAGDVAEATSLGSVLGLGRRDDQPPLIIGSVKSNFGHTEGAAGVASVIKTALVLEKKKIPKLVNFSHRNEKIDWDKYHLSLPTELMDWPGKSKFIAGCNGFGFGGANAHIVLEAAPIKRLLREEHAGGFSPALLFLSADSPSALKQRVSDWVEFMKLPSNGIANFRNILLTAALRATHHQYRLVIYCESFDQTIDILEKRLENPPEVANMLVEGQVQKIAPDKVHKLVFVFSGMGTQWWAMGRQLMESDQTFRTSISKIDLLLKELGANWSLLHMLTKETDKENINNTEIAQPAICAVQISLVEVYRHYGIQPHFIIGHSVGEVAAAYVAGYMSLRDAVRLIYVRGKSLQQTVGRGKMAAILAPVSQVKEKLELSEYVGKINIACVNSSSQTVISGDRDVVETFVDLFKAQGIRCVILKVQNAFHSFQQEEVKDYFFKHTEFLKRPKFQLGNKYAPQQIPMISTVNGKFVNAQVLNSSVYWWQNIRQTVEFADSLNTLFTHGCNVFIEIGPHPSLASSIKNEMNTFSEQSISFFHESSSVISSLKRPTHLSLLPTDNLDIMLSIAKLHVQGFQIQLGMLFSVESFELVTLPKYPWQHKQFSAITSKATELYITPRKTHPLLGKCIKSLPSKHSKRHIKTWKSKYSRRDLPWLHHHKIENVVILPGAVFVEMMLSAASATIPSSKFLRLEKVQFRKFHYSPDSKGLLHTTLSQIDDEGNACQIVITTYDDNEDSWTENATCEFSTSNSEETDFEEHMDINGYKEKMTDKYSVEALYKILSDNGVQIGHLFRAVVSAYFSDDNDEIMFIAALPAALQNESDLYIIHPAIFDACFQVVGMFFMVNRDMDGMRGSVVPHSVGSLDVQCRIPQKVVIHARKKCNGTQTTFTVKIADIENGKIIANINNIQLAKIHSAERPHECIWQREWEYVDLDSDVNEGNDSPIKVSVPTKNPTCYILPDNLGVAEILVEHLITDCVFLADSIHLGEFSDNEISIPPNKNDLQHVIILQILDEFSSVSLEEITKDDFVHSQTDVILKLIKNVVNYFSAHQTNNVAIWIVTKGAMIVSPTDTFVNPFMSKAHAISLTSANETPQLFVATIDLPQNMSLTQCASMLSQFFRNPIMSENCLALRLKQEQSSAFDYEVYALRLTAKSTLDLIYIQPCDEWMIDLQGISNTRSVISCIKPWKDANKEDSLELKVKLEAYIQKPYKELQQSHTSHTGFFFAGSIFSDQSQNSKYNCIINKRVVGYCRSHILTSTIESKPSDFIILPQNVGLMEGLVVISSCLPLYIAVQKLRGTLSKSDAHVLMIASNNMTIHFEFAKHFTRSTNINIILLMQTMNDIDKFNTGHERVKILSKDLLDIELTPSSVDTLVIDPELKLDDKYIDVILNKMCIFGTVVVIGETPLKSKKLQSRQIDSVIVDMQVMLSHECQYLLNEMMTSLLQLMFDSERGIDSLISCCDIVPLDKATAAQLLGGSIVQSLPSIDVPFKFGDFNYRFRAEQHSSYLVVGGTKGVGFEVVRWLVSHGAKMIYIAGRNAPSKEICDQIDLLHHNIEFIQCDISVKTETAQMLKYIKHHSKFPLQGVFHCAAVFDDQRLQNVTKESWNNVMLPKAYGALLLHQLTLQLDIQLKQFVVFSSIVEYLGNGGQGSYCTANAFLTSLCESRRLLGLPATVFAPGAISKVGYAARKGYDKFFESRGMMSISPEQINEALAWSLATDTKSFGMTGEINKMLFAQTSPLFNQQNAFRHFSILKKEFSKDALSAFLELENMLTSSNSPAVSNKLIMDVLKGFLQNRLGITHEISQNVSLASYGLDSAMAFELSAVIQRDCSTTVSSVELLNDTNNILVIVNLIYERATKRDENASTEIRRNLIKESTPWLEQPREIKTASADLFCFPCTGKGTTMFADIADECKKNGIRVWVVKLPGWEGRENEKPTHDLENLVSVISSCILPRMKARRTLCFGSGIGSLLAFEVIRRLQSHHSISIKHFFVTGWYPPSVPCFTFIKNPVNYVVKTNHSKLDERSTPFLDNRDIRQTQSNLNVGLNVQASEKICTSYKYVQLALLQCNITVFSGKQDRLLSPKINDMWQEEIHRDYKFENIIIQTDHKLLRNKKSNKQIVSKILHSLN